VTYVSEADDRYNRKIKERAINAYGGECAQCHIRNYQYLTIDHMNNDGAEHRKTVPGGHAFYLWLKRHHYPPGFQVLCQNHNAAKYQSPEKWQEPYDFGDDGA
jgi:hypothetical protein